MAKYKALKKSFINNCLLEAGDVVEVPDVIGKDEDGNDIKFKPGSNLEIVKEKKAAKAKDAE